MGGSLYYNELTGKFVKIPVVFIETGTYKGDTVRNMGPYFSRVYSVEISPTLYQECVDNCSHITNAYLYLGDSTTCLDEILTIPGNNEAVFFFDAHLSGIDTIMNGIENVPVISELKKVLSFSPRNSIFVFDDVRFFGVDQYWFDITTDRIRDMINDAGCTISHAFVDNDRYYISVL